MAAGERDRLLDLLAAAHDAVVGRIADRFAATLPAYAAFDAAERRAAPDPTGHHLLRAAREGRGLTDAERAVPEEFGARRARQGVPLEQVLHTWRLAAAVMLEELRALAREHGIDDTAVLDAHEALQRALDDGALAAARGHRQVELEAARHDENARLLFVRGVLTGTLAPAQVRAGAAAHRLAADRPYWPFRARAAGLADRQVERALGLSRQWSDASGMAAGMDGDVVGLRAERPPRDLPFACGVGPARPLEQLAESFRVASRAAETAYAFGLRGTFALGELGLRPAVLADADVRAALHARYAAPVSDDLLTSVATYLACRRHVDTAAARLHVHPNTLRHRLARFAGQTGADLDDPACLAEVWWVVTASNLVPGTLEPTPMAAGADAATIAP